MNSISTQLPLITFPNQRTHKSLIFQLKTQKRFNLGNYPRLFCPKASSNGKGSVNSTTENEDFVTRVLRENPSQIEPKYLVGNKLHTLKEKESLKEKGVTEKVLEVLKILNLKGIVKGNESGFVAKSESDVYLSDLLREYKGKLYVPEQTFGTNLSEEETFDKDVKELPRMSYDDFQKFTESGKVKLVTYKEDGVVSYGNVYRDFVVELEEMPGDKRLHMTKWTLRLDEEQGQDLLETYEGPRKEIEKQMMSWVGKVPEYPNPVASKISSRIIVELGVVSAALAAAAFVVGGFLASAVFAVTSFVFAVATYVICSVTWNGGRPSDLRLRSLDPEHGRIRDRVGSSGDPLLPVAKIVVLDLN